MHAAIPSTPKTLALQMASTGVVPAPGQSMTEAMALLAAARNAAYAEAARGRLGHGVHMLMRAMNTQPMSFDLQADMAALLLTAGLQGSAVVATDACVSSVLAVFKTAVFQGAGALTPPLWLLALAIGAASVPGAFLAAAITRRMALRYHTLALDAVVLLGGALLVERGLSALP